MKKKNVLFVGDFTPARNYGSIATSEAMKFLIKTIVSDYEKLRVIDSRSYYQETPPEGFPPYVLSFNEFKSLKQIIYHFVPNFLKKEKSYDYVPYKFSLYEDYYQKLLNSEIFIFERKMLEWADVVLCSGEGSLVRGIDKNGRYLIGGLYQLFLLWLSKIKYNKPTILVNHTVDTGNKEADEIIKNLYPFLDFVAVREKLSLKTLENLGISHAKFIPDALFSYQPVPNWKPSKKILEQIDFSKPYICLGDSSGITKNKYNTPVKWDIVHVYSDLISELKKVIPQIVFVDGFRGTNKEINKVIKRNRIGYVNLKNCSYHDLFYVLKNAELFISGRWHASILSLLANTPIILMGADSHKTKGLYELINYDYDFFELQTLPIYISEIRKNVESILASKDKVKKNISEKVKELSQHSRENVSFLRKILNEENK